MNVPSQNRRLRRHDRVCRSITGSFLKLFATQPPDPETRQCANSSILLRTAEK
jgi:hypothetical protein